MTSAETVVVRKAPLDVRILRAFGRLTDKVTQTPYGLHQAALLRIGYGAVFFISLVREYVNRSELWGSESPWSNGMARQLLGNIDGYVGAHSLLLFSDSRWWFEFVYVAALVVAALFTLGWHTRAMSVLFFLMVVSFNSRSILMTDGGDTVMSLLAIYLMFTACGRRWSLDARRARRSPGTDHPEPGIFVGLVAVVAANLFFGMWALLAAPLVLAGLLRPRRDVELARKAAVTALHNCALLVIAAEVCIVYACAGLYKVQGSRWQDGTAMHYVMNLDYFQPWPALSGLLDGSSTMGTVVTYLTVFVQIGFPFLVFAVRAKYVAVAILVGMHLGIALMLGLPAFSASMAIGDVIFLPTVFLLFVRGKAGVYVKALLKRPSTLKT